MKRVFLILTLCTCFLSCSKSLSCDPTVSAWANENLEYYASASRNEIVSLPLSRQRAIYQGLSSERKVELWREKMNLVIESGVLSTKEIKDYTLIFDFLRPSHYDSKKGLEKLNAYANEWQEMMQKKHQWDDEKLFLYSHIWMTHDEFISSVISDNLITKAITPPGNDVVATCECIYSIYCRTSGLGSVCVDTPDCKQGTENCGIVGSSNCSGTCQ